MRPCKLAPLWCFPCTSPLEERLAAVLLPIARHGGRVHAPYQSISILIIPQAGHERNRHLGDFGMESR